MNFGQFQSAYRKQHSTETALSEVLDNAYAAADMTSQFFVLVGLDLPAAFDPLSHDTLLQRLLTEFGVTGTVLSWLRSYLSCRSQFVKLGNHQSSAVSLNVGVPQGSVLGPIYCSPVGDVIAWHGVQYHQHADGTQLHLAMRSDNTAAGLSTLAACTSYVRLVHAERSATQSGQVRSSARRNVTTVEASKISRAVCDHRWC